ncbi:MAG: TIGR03862 family flavoprotein [Alphaproteobacteria bacterium]|nr:TIGR03862 family flavoprotein [Alphaproteobacteria bacterium]
MENRRNIAIIGAGPSALIAAEELASHGHNVSVYDRMPSPARKLLIAGRGGLNLTHSEPLDEFLTRYGTARDWLTPAILAFPPDALRAWCDGLGEETFIGSSGRVFPRKMKAVSLLRAWLKRLEQLGVTYHPRHHWLGWHGDALSFDTPKGAVHITPDATLLALGGASWPRLGSDGGWVKPLTEQAIPMATLAPTNCGFHTHWSDYFRTRFAGSPLKPLAITHEGATHQGEAIITANGLEGGAIYGLSASIRNAINRDGQTTITLDLRPSMSPEALSKKLASRGNKSLSSFLRSANFSPVAIALFHETTPEHMRTTAPIAERLKALPVTLHSTAGMARAISSAGGITRDALDEHYMLRAKPGVFAAGEMLDWEAPTGGYLLQACFSTGVAAAHGIIRYLKAT